MEVILNTKKYIIGSIVVFIAMYAMDFILHGLILAGQYAPLYLQGVLRSDTTMLTYMPAMLLGDLFIAFGFCYLYVRGREGKGIGEGVRFGLIVGLAFGVGPALINYSVYPLSGWIMLAYFIGYPIQCMILGVIIAAMYNPATK